MTNQAGSSNKVEEPSGPPPWERKWNDVKDTVGKAVDAVVDTAKKVIGGSQMPWEKNWGGSTPSVSKAAPSPVRAPSKPFLETEAKMIKAAQFTPAEIQARDVSMRSPETIKELKDEISRTKDAKIKQVLETELAKLQRK